jgi:hypothetical protein
MLRTTCAGLHQAMPIVKVLTGKYCNGASPGLKIYFAFFDFYGKPSSTVGSNVLPLAGSSIPPVAGTNISPVLGSTISPLPASSLPPIGSNVSPVSASGIPEHKITTLGTTVLPGVVSNVSPVAGPTISPASGSSIPPLSGTKLSSSVVGSNWSPQQSLKDAPTAAVESNQPSQSSHVPSLLSSLKGPSTFSTPIGSIPSGPIEPSIKLPIGATAGVPLNSVNIPTALKVDVSSRSPAHPLGYPAGAITGSFLQTAVPKIDNRQGIFDKASEIPCPPIVHQGLPCQNLLQAKLEELPSIIKGSCEPLSPSILTGPHCHHFAADQKNPSPMSSFNLPLSSGATVLAPKSASGPQKILEGDQLATKLANKKIITKLQLQTSQKQKQPQSTYSVQSDSNKLLPGTSPLPISNTKATPNPVSSSNVKGPPLTIQQPVSTDKLKASDLTSPISTTASKDPNFKLAFKISDVTIDKSAPKI